MLKIFIKSVILLYVNSPKLKYIYNILSKDKRRAIVENSQNRCIKIHLKDNRIKNFIVKKIFETKHFENILLILIAQDFKQNDGKNFKYLTNFSIMKAVITDDIHNSSRKKEAEYIQSCYKNNQLMKDLKLAARNLKILNVLEQIKYVKKGYENYLNSDHKTDLKCPKPKKLSKLKNATLYISNRGYSLSSKNKIGIDIASKTVYTHIDHCELKKSVGNLKNIKNININYCNGEIYLNIIYISRNQIIKMQSGKIAGIDIGLNNLASIYIDDADSTSIIIDGKRFKLYNSKFNSLNSKLCADIKRLKSELAQNYLDTKKIKRLNYLKALRMNIIEKRKRYFESEFSKISKRIIEYLCQKQVSRLAISKTMCNIKRDDMSTEQNFIQIPIIKLISYIESKAKRYGIDIIEVDENFTSQVSSISADICKLNQKMQKEKLLTNDFKGIRVKRGLYKDTHINKVFNADLNGALNIVKLTEQIEQKEIQLYKLCNPKKFRSDYELVKFIQTNSKVG